MAENAKDWGSAVLDVDQKEVTLEWYKSNVQWTRDLGMLAIKTLITLNSGAFVVLLTFIGNSAAQSAFSVPIFALQTAMVSFLTGIVAVFLVIAFAFVNNNLMNPYDVTKGFSDSVAMPIYLIFAAFGLVAFIFGVVKIVINVSMALPFTSGG